MPGPHPWRRLIEYWTLGNTDIEVSRLIFGTMTLGLPLVWLTAVFV